MMKTLVQVLDLMQCNQSYTLKQSSFQSRLNPAYLSLTPNANSLSLSALVTQCDHSSSYII